MTESHESEASSCDIDCDNYHDKETKKGRNKFRVNSTEWNIDKTRLVRLRKVEVLPIPQQSINILSKLVINYQLLDIVEVLKNGKNCLSLHAKVNLKKEIFNDLETDDVIVKIFTRRNHTKPDIDAAKQFKVFVFSKDRIKNYEGTQWNRRLYTIDKECLPIVRMDNIVVMKMIGSDKLAPNLIQMITRNSHNLQAYYQELLELVISFRNRDYKFWNEKSSVKNILWHNNEWNIIDYGDDRQYCYSKDYERRGKIFVENLILIMRAFHLHGLSREKLKMPLFDWMRKVGPHSSLKEILLKHFPAAATN